MLGREFISIIKCYNINIYRNIGGKTWQLSNKAQFDALREID